MSRSVTDIKSKLLLQPSSGVSRATPNAPSPAHQQQQHEPPSEYIREEDFNETVLADRRRRLRALSSEHPQQQQHAAATRAEESNRESDKNTNAAAEHDKKQLVLFSSSSKPKEKRRTLSTSVETARSPALTGVVGQSSNNAQLVARSTGAVSKSAQQQSSEATPAAAVAAESAAARALRYATFPAHTDWITTGQFFNHDQLVLTSSHDARVKIWHYPDMKLLHTLTGPRECVSRAVVVAASGGGDDDGAAQPQCAVASSWDESVYMWNIETGQNIWSYAAESLLTCCDVGRNDTNNVVVASSDGDKAIWLFDVRARAPIKYMRDYLSGSILTCKMASDGRHFAAGGACNTVKIYDMVSGATTITLNDCGSIVSDVAFSPDGKRFCVASWDTLLRLYDINEGAYRLHGESTLTGEHEGCVSCCSYNSDSTLLVSGGFDTTMCIWDARNYDVQFRLQPHETAWVTACAFSANGECVMSGSKTGEIRFWRFDDLRQTPAYRARLRERGKLYQCSACKRPFSILECEEDDATDTTHKEELVGEQQRNRLCMFCRRTPDMHAVDVEQRFHNLVDRINNVNKTPTRQQRDELKKLATQDGHVSG